MRSIKSAWLLILVLFCCFACNSMGGKDVEARPGGAGAAAPTPGETREEVPMKIELSEGRPVDPAGEESAVVQGTPLSQARVDALLKLFKEPLEEEKEKPEFLKRPGSKPAPRSATPKEMPFPPTGDGDRPPEATSGPLEVLSISPEGALERAPRLSISFNNPMIAVSDPSVDESGSPLGITIEPRPRGKWRWLGTQTLIFEPEGSEFPRATEYTVTVPAGVADVNGSQLTEPVVQRFSLPRPKVESFSPTGGGLDLEPLLYVLFDQPVEPEATLKLIRLRRGGTDIPLRRLTGAEAEQLQPGVTRQFEGDLSNRVFFFRAAEKLTPDTTYTLSVAAGIKSAEGPLLSETEQSASFSTYAPLKMVSRYPQEGEERSPFSDFSINFNNALDEEAFDETMVTVKPSLEHLKVRVVGNSLYISGPKSGKTTYTVSISPRLADRFGQTLGRELVLEMKTGRAPQVLSHGFSTFTVLDPTVKPGLPIYSTNIEELDLEVYQVTPEQWPDYLAYLASYRRAYTPEDRKALTVPGRRVAQTTLSLERKPDELVTTRVDLTDYLDNNEGNLIVWVKDPTEDQARYRSREFVTWVQGTRLGIDLEVGVEEAVVMVTRLADGEPVSGALVKMGETERKAGDDGLATLPLPSKMSPLLRVEADGSEAFLPASISEWNPSGGWQRRSLQEEPRWFLFNDRGLYRPGEKARVKGYVRAWQRGPKGGLNMLGKSGQTVNWILNDPRGNKVAQGTTTLNAFSAIDLELQFPPETNLGHHQLSISGGGLPPGYHALHVQEFRRPEFEVKTSVLSDQPHLLHGSATVETTASYYAGGPLANADVQWSVTATPSSYTPPGRGDFTFGEWTPWWDMGHWWMPGRRSENAAHYSFQGKTDGGGVHLLGMEFVDVYPPKPTTVSATASVADVNRQQQASSTNLLVHPSERYVGVRAEKSFIDERSDFKVEFIVTDIDGRILPGVPVDLQLLEVEYEWSRAGGYSQKETLVEAKRVTSTEAPEEVVLAPGKGGTYRVRAFVRDQKERLNQTTLTLWRAGGELPSRDKVELESLTVVPDRKEYEPGQTARLLVMAPFRDGEGLVVWDRDGLVREERFTLKNGTATLEQPITEEMIPNLRASITVVGSAQWGKRKRPAVAASSLNLSISTESRRLAVELQPTEDKLEPGAEVDVPVLVKDHAGAPVSGSEVTLWVVDEAVLGLTGYTTPDPLQSFYTDRPGQMTARHNRIHVALADPEMAAEVETGVDLEGAAASQYMRSMPMAAAPAPALRQKARSADMAMEAAPEGSFLDEAQEGPSEFAVRKNFDALAMFRADLQTDASGRASVRVKLPDSLTRYRIMSVAVKGGDKFGHGDDLLTARLPVMVRPSLPRFLNFGDQVKLPVVIQNQTDEALTVDVVGQANGVAWVGAAGQSVQVPANDRVEVMFEARADQVGRAHFRFGAVSGSFSDAATLSLPVYTPASGEAFATYGSIAEDGAVKQPVRRPDEVWPQFGGLRVSLSSTALSELTDAFLYLYEYPFECSEQKASRVLGIAAMREVLSAMNPALMPSDAEIEARMKQDLLHLERLQNSDGGFGFWRRDEDSVPFVTVHVMHALARAKLEGYETNANTLERGMAYLRDIEAKCRAKKYGDTYTRVITAYALYVRNLLGDPDAAKAKALLPHFTGGKHPNLEAIGWVWPTLSQHAKGSDELAEIRRFVRNRATETADKAQFTGGYGEGEGEYLLLYSDRRTDAVLLDAMLIDAPNDPLNTKLVRGLLAHRKKGRWKNTQENIWVLLALQTYFRAYEKDAPNFLASLWLDDTFLGEERFEGRSGKEAYVEVPMARLPEETADLFVAKQGTGRLYYRVGMEYAPKSLRLPAENRGFLVERSYRGLDSESDVKRLENGDWEVKAGAKVEVTLTMVCPERRYHVALVDQLPAGLEPLNPVLRGTPPTSHGGSVERGRGWHGWWWHWYEHQNLRDERVEAFASLVYPGVYTYTYTALATTPGEYVLPPLKAEEMYSPEVFGRTATGRFVVK